MWQGCGSVKLADAPGAGCICEKQPGICRTLVVDTIDWAEAKCVEHICTEHQKRGIEDFGYGNGYVYAKEEFGRFLNRLSGCGGCRH